MPGEKMTRLIKERIVKGIGKSIFAQNIIILDSVGSTNVYAKKLAGEGAPEGTVVIAEDQTEGKGRMGRSWESRKYANILMSIMLRPDIEVHKIFVLTMMAALAAVKAVEELFRLRPKIKWPNDIFVNEKKLAGILTEFSAKGKLVEYVIVGLGLNVNWNPEVEKDKKYRTTCIRDEVGGFVSRENLLVLLLLHLESYYKVFLGGNFDELYGLWNEHSMVTGKEVEIVAGDKLLCGTVLRIDRFGALILKDETGNERKVVYGDVSLREKKNESDSYRKTS